MRTIAAFLLVAACEDVRPGSTPTGPSDCTPYTQDLLNRFGLHAQLVLNLSLGDQGTYDTMVDFELPDPETFRAMEAGFDGLNLAGVTVLPSFQSPSEARQGLLVTADALDDVLDDPVWGNAAWTELAALYTTDFFVNHNASVNYYLDEAGCLP